MGDLCTRRAKYQGEKVIVKREGAGSFWHARTEDGELICKDQYRHDLQLFCETYGFDWEMIGE